MQGAAMKGRYHEEWIWLWIWLQMSPREDVGKFHPQLAQNPNVSTEKL